MKDWIKEELKKSNQTEVPVDGQTTNKSSLVEYLSKIDYIYYMLSILL
jgi:hypothetical protein